MTSLRFFPASLTLLLASAVAGLLLALYAYFAPLTGVTGTVGALAVIVACAVLAAMALALGAVENHATRITLRVLSGLLLLTTCFAALLLHRWGICVAMGVGLVGLVMEVFHSAGTQHGAQA